MKGTSALAGLSVNCAIFNVLAALSSPLCTGTLALVAKARGKAERNSKFESVFRILKYVSILNPFCSTERVQ